MPSTQHIIEIVDKVKNRLAEAEKRGIHLRVASEKLDDDWLYIVVVPTQPGVRASDHALTMSQIERELRENGDNNVLLVPSVDE